MNDNSPRVRAALALLGLAWILPLAACGGASGTGKVQVFLSAEDSITSGVEPGSGAENIQDGWTVTYQKFLITVGNFRAWRSTKPTERLVDPRVFVLDMKKLPAGGFPLAEFAGVAAERWDKAGYDMPNASAASQCDRAVSAADCALMKGGGYSVYFEGTLTKDGGTSCKPTAPTDCVNRSIVAFKWGFKAGTSYDDCSPSTGDAGFAVPTGGTVSIKPTIHGDHWFFTSFVHEEAKRRAQWIADADLDRNGETTLDELQHVQASDVFPPGVYNLSGAGPIATAFDYVVAQLRSIGHYQGDGDCQTRSPIQ